MLEGVLMVERNPLIGQRVAAIRTLRGLSQMDLARLTNQRQHTISRLETGHQTVVAENLAAIARVLEVSADYLLGLRDDPVGYDA